MQRITFKNISNALVTLVKTKEDCLKKLLKTVRTTRRISELVRQRVPDRRTSDQKRLTAVYVESTARYDELVSVRRTQMKPRSGVRGCDEMVSEVIF